MTFWKLVLAIIVAIVILEVVALIFCGLFALAVMLVGWVRERRIYGRMRRNQLSAGLAKKGWREKWMR